MIILVGLIHQVFTFENGYKYSSQYLLNFKALLFVTVSCTESNQFFICVYKLKDKKTLVFGHHMQKSHCFIGMRKNV